MYDYLSGKLVELTPAYAVIECAGAGYFINISLNTYSKLSEPSSGSPLNKDCKLYVHQVVREDALVLFGFEDKQEREIFLLLITVSGIGANIARMILSSLSTKEIRKAIRDSDVNLLKSIKGIGTKSAQRIIVDLKDKLGKVETGDEIFTDKSNIIKEESLSALVMLGFSKGVVEKVIDSILATEKDIPVEELIKKALKKL